MKDIGNLLNCSAGTIFKYFKKYEIKTRKWGSNNEFAKKKISLANKGRTSCRRGIKLSEETKKKITEGHRKKGIGHKKIRADGYVSIYFPDHPKSNKDGYVMEHDLIMECCIGRWLKDDEVVHHINKIRNDNRIENLKILTKSEHARLHMLERKGVMTYQ